MLFQTDGFTGSIAAGQLPISAIVRAHITLCLMLQEYNELAVVSSTRFVVGQGCLIKHVLTGREAVSLFAAGVPCGANGMPSAQTFNQVKAMMSSYGEVKISDNMTWSGKCGTKITFQDSQAAARALEGCLVQTGGQKDKLWTSLQPFIQKPREATMAQVCRSCAESPSGKSQQIFIEQL
jgi:hypothetical protein